MQFIRTLHIYLTALVAALFGFIALTGLALTHESWFGLDSPHTTTRVERLPADLLGNPDKLAWVEFARARFAAAGPVEPFDLSDTTVVLQFRSPGHKTDIAIDRAAGTATATLESRGLLGALTDLHRAKEVPAPFRLFLDVAAISIFLAALTGAILLFHPPKRRRIGLIALVAGTATCVAVYMLVVL